MKILVVVQARMASTRLPGKVMMPLAGRPLLQRMLERIRAARSKFDLTVATTVGRADDPIRALCGNIGANCFSGHPTDLLDRHYRAGSSFRADAVVKIPSDCPLISPAVIDRVIGAFIRSHQHGAGDGRGHHAFDFISNLHPASYPDGNDVEIMTMGALGQAWAEAGRPMEREHTTPFIWERPGRFGIGNVRWDAGLDYSMSHRWTIDYPDDYRFIKAVYDELWTEQRPIFSLEDILLLLHARPDISAINSKYAGVNWYRHHLGELKTISACSTRFAGAEMAERETRRAETGPAGPARAGAV